MSEKKGPKVAFLFSGYGSAYAGMGTRFYQTHQVFRDAVSRCAQTSGDAGLAVVSALGQGLTDSREGSAAHWEGPVLFAMQMALVELWRSWGVEPQLVLGYGPGEFAAACTAEALSFEDTWKLVVAQGRLSRDLGAAGRHALACLDAAEARGLIAALGLGSEVFVAAAHHNNEVLLSGSVSAMAVLLDKLAVQGTPCRPLQTQRAWHSPLMRSVTTAFAGELAQATFRAARKVMASSVTGGILRRRRDEAPQHDLLGRQASEPVRFSEALAEVVQQDDYIFIEIGPGDHLLEVGRVLHPGKTWLASSGGASEIDAMLDALRALDRAGLTVRVPSTATTPSRDATEAAAKREGGRATATEPASLAGALVGAPENERVELLRAQIRNQVGRVLGLSHPKPLKLDQPFRELGLDSLMTVELWVRLSKDIGRQLDPALAFTYPTINALAEYLSHESFPTPVAGPIKRRASDDDIAIVGMACRFPGGADTPEAYWRILHEGIDAVSEVPRERWDSRKLYDPDQSAAGKTITRWGGFLRDVDRFDAGFFSISPREALSMDPQQRLLLETAWEALEDAGHSPHELRGSDTAVFVGVTYGDYYQRWGALAERPERYDLYAATGNTNAIAAGRVAYFFDFRGPTLALDTACSSSLVALHMAAAALRRGETSLAMVSGVNLILSPETTVNFSRARMMSPDGRCKTFDARANGYVRAEGCATIVVKKMSDAVRDGDRVLALVRGTAVNHDGRSNGLTAPNALAQQALVRSALEAARLSPNDVEYVEAHGTGTPLGDPTELQALRAALTDETPREAPLVVGSVKTNIGHTEAAAGLAGLMKVVLAMQHEEIPKHLHFENLNPHIPNAGLPIHVPARAQAWRRGAKPRVAGVSAFGFSGTNAHAILQEAPLSSANAAPTDRPLHVATVSARSPESLQMAARRFSEHLRDNTDDLADICFTANAGRAHFEHRAAMVVSSNADLRAKLDQLAEGASPAGTQVGRLVSGSDKPRVAFLFSGQASLYRDAGRELYDTQPTFKQALDRCAQILAPKLDVSLLDILFPKTEAQAELHLQTRYGQPALIAFEVALAGLWRSFGLEPDAVLGHSVGEFAACCVAEAAKLEDVLPLVTVRGALMQGVAEGRMLSVTADETTVRDLLAAQRLPLSVAAINGPQSIVVAGPVDAVATFTEELGRRGIKSKMLESSRAFHSAMLDSVLDALEAEAARVEVGQPRIPVVSNLTGRMYWRRKDELPNGAYWRRHAREAVQFAAGVRTLVDHGCSLFVEIGPRATLLGPASECVDRPDIAWVPSLRRSAGCWAQLLESVATLYSRGAEIDWRRFDGDYDRRRVSLPTYPFERQRFWIDPPSMSPSPVSQAGGAHPLLGVRHESPLGSVQFDISLGGRCLGYLVDHVVQDKIILPGAGSIEMAIAGAEAVAGKRSWVLEDIRFVKAVVLSESQARPLQLVFAPPNGGRRDFQLVSRPSDVRVWEGGGWTVHASGRIAEALRDDELAPTESLQALRARLTQRVGATEHYATMNAMGLRYGPAFQTVTEAFHDPDHGEVLVHIAARVDELNSEEHVLHPAVLDACFQAFSAAGDKRIAASGSFMPIGIERLTVHKHLKGEAWGYARVRQGATAAASRVLLGDVQLFDDAGELVATVTGMRSLRVEELLIDDAVREPRELIHDVVWRRLPPVSAQVGSQRWLIFCDRGGVGEALAGLLERRGHRCVKVSAGSRFAAVNAGYELRVNEPNDYAALLQAVTGNGQPPLHGVVHLWSFDAPVIGAEAAALDLDAGHVSGCHSAVLAAQALVRAGASLQLLFVTRGAQAVGVAVGLPPAVDQAAMLGLGRALQVEHPELQCRRVDLPPGSDAAQSAHWLAGEVGVAGEPEVALRSDGRYAPRLIGRSTLGPRAPFSCRPDGTYVVSGAFGGLGRELSRWLVQRGAKHLLLLGRRDPSVNDTAFVEELVGAGAQVQVSNAGVTDAQAVRKLFADIKGTMPEVRGVVHVAGILEDGVFTDITWPKLSRVLAPKVQGAWNLHINTVGLPLDFLVFFSSVSALWGAAGQASYAAANAWLDSLAHARRAAGLAALSINWGPWNAGMAAAGGARSERRWRDQGLAMMSPREALPALEQLLAEKATHAAVFAIAARGKFLEHQQHGFSTLFDEWEHELAEAAPQAAQPVTPELPQSKSTGLLEQLRAAPEAQRLSLIGDFVQKVVRKQLGAEASQRLSPQQPFMDMGLDSLMIANVRRELMQAVGKSLPVTIAFDYPTLDALTTHVAQDVLGVRKNEPPAQPEPSNNQDAVAALLDRVATLTDAEAEALLAAKLGGLS